MLFQLAFSVGGGESGLKASRPSRAAPVDTATGQIINPAWTVKPVNITEAAWRIIVSWLKRDIHRWNCRVHGEWDVWVRITIPGNNKLSFIIKAQGVLLQTATVGFRAGSIWLQPVSLGDCRYVFFCVCVVLNWCLPRGGVLPQPLFSIFKAKWNLKTTKTLKILILFRNPTTSAGLHPPWQRSLHSYLPSALKLSFSCPLSPWHLFFFKATVSVWNFSASVILLSSLESKLSKRKL